MPFLPQRVSLKLKMFGGTMAVVLFVSAVIAILARWILVTSLNRELEQRGVAIGQSIAERASGFILDKDRPNLVSLVFDAAQLGERKVLVSYIFISDNDGRILANTFIRPFPADLRGINPLPENKDYSIDLVDFDQSQAIDIAVPVREGIYTLGAVHVGLSKTHIDSLVGKLRTTFLGFINARVLVEGLRRCGRELTRERFLDAIESIQDFSVGIASPVSYGRDRRQGLDRVYFTRFDRGRFHMVTDWAGIKDALEAGRAVKVVPNEQDGRETAPTPAPGG